MRPESATKGARQPLGPLGSRETNGRLSSIGGLGAPVGHKSLDSLASERLSVSSRRSSRSTAILKDDRPINQDDYRRKSIKTLISYLVQIGFDVGPYSLQTLELPCDAFVKRVFKALYHKLDGQYVFPTEMHILAEDMSFLFHHLRYPLANTLTPSLLVASTSPHAWPMVLAALVWMVELIQYAKIAQDASHDVPLTKEEEERKTFFDYLVACHSAFARDRKEYEMVIRVQQEIFQSGLNNIKGDLNRTEADKAQLEAEHDELERNISSLAVLQQCREDLMSSIESLAGVVAEQKRNCAKYSATIQKQYAANDKTQNELREVLAEKNQLLASIASRTMSVEEIEHLKATYAQRQEELAEAGRKLLWHTDNSHKLKHELAQKEASRQTISCFLLDGMKDLSLDSPLTYDPSNSLTLLSQLKEGIEPALLRAKDEWERKHHAIIDLKFSVQRETDAVVQEYLDREALVNGLENDVERLENALQSVKEAITDEEKIRLEEITDLDARIERMEKNEQLELRAAQERLAKLNQELTLLEQHQFDEKENFSKRVLVVLEEVITYKLYVETALEKLRKHVIAVRDGTLPIE